MEKLIELLNEMIKSKGNCYKIIDYTGGVFIIDDKANKYRCNLYPAVVISKGYGFIERLVKNDKIDLEEVEKINQTGNVYIRFGGDYEKVLMLLSIQDNPIEYLCSILKE